MHSHGFQKDLFVYNYKIDQKYKYLNQKTLPSRENICHIKFGRGVEELCI